MVPVFHQSHYNASCIGITYQHFSSFGVTINNIYLTFIFNILFVLADRLFNVKTELEVTTETMRKYIYRDGLFGSECTLVLDHITVARYVKLSVVGETFLSVCEMGVYSLI